MATASDITSGLTGVVQGLGSVMRSMGIAVTAASGIAAGAMFTLSRRAAEVNEAFREVDTITSSTANSQEKYGEIVSRLNTELGVNTDRLGAIKALYLSVSAGINESVESQRKFLESAARLSVVGRTELATTVDVLSTSINAYGASNMTAKRASDALFATVQFGKTTLEELAPVMGRVIALGSDMDVTIEELGASMAVLTRTGFESRIAATGLRAVLRGLMKPSEDLQGVLRDIALEQNGVVEALTRGKEGVNDLASSYRQATTELNNFEQAQRAARNTVEQTSLKIQRARLAVQAIEEGRVNQLEDVQTKNLAVSNSVEELRSKIEEYRFEVNQARLKEEESRLEAEKRQNTIEDLREQFKNQLDVQGDLGEGIGQLVVKNEGFVETLVKVRDRAQEQGIAMDDLFDRSRGLQAALALLSDDGEELSEIFTAMRDDSEVTESEMAKLEERFGTTREEVKNLQEGVTEVENQFSETQGAVQKQRNAFGELEEAAQDLGQAFIDPLNKRITNLANFLERTVTRFNKLDETIRGQIGTFFVLASAIGLIVGPLLILGGQIALISSAMGSLFIPFMLAAGSAIGVLGKGLVLATKDGKQTEEMFASLQSTLSGLVSFLTFLKNVFVEEVLPGMIVAGEGVVAVFSAIFSEVDESVGGSGSLIRQFGSVVGSVFRAIGNVLKNNAQAIGNFVGALAGIFVNLIIPAVMKFGKVVSNDVFPEVVTTIQTQVIPAVESLWESFKTTILPFLVDTVANTLIPALSSLANTLTSTVIPNISNFIQGNSDAIVKAGAFATVLFGLSKAFSVVAGIVGPLIPKIVGLGRKAVVVGRKIVGLTRFVRSASTALLGLQRSAFAARIAIAGLGGPVGFVAGLVATLAALWASDVGNMREKLQPLADAVVDFGSQFVDKTLPAIMNFLGSVGKLIAEIGGLVAVFFNAGEGSHMLRAAVKGVAMTIDGLGDLLLGVVQLATAFVDAFRVIVLFLQGDFQKAWKVFLGIADEAVNGVKNILKGLAKVVIGILVTILGSIFGFFTDLVKAVQQGFMTFLRITARGMPELKNIMVSGFKELVNIVVGFFSDLGDRIGEAFPGEQIKSFINDIGESVAKRFKEGLESIGNIGQFFIDQLSSIGERISDSASDVYSNIKRTGKELAKALKDGIGDTISSLGSLIAISPSDAFDWGKSLIQSIADGISNAGDIIKDAIRDAAGKLSSFLPSSPAQQGPFSKPNHPEARGKSLAKNVAKGIKGGESDFEEAIKSLTDKELQEISGALGFDLSSIGSRLEQQNVGSGINPTQNQQLAQQDSRNTEQKVEVSEKAIYFEQGAFQGVSDEELPMKVREVFDESMRDIVQEIDGAGKQKTN